MFTCDRNFAKLERGRSVYDVGTPDSGGMTHPPYPSVLCSDEKIRIAYPRNNTCKLIDIQDDNRLFVSHAFVLLLGRQSIIGLHIGQVFRGDEISRELTGYVFRITGGCDKQGFPMRRGIMSNRRVRLLVKPGQTGYQAWRAPRKGARRRKSVRGAIVDLNLSVLECVIVKKGDQEIKNLTDVEHLRKRCPLRASKIRRLFDLEDDFDLTKFLPIYKTKQFSNGFVYVKRPRVQRLLTPRKIRRRRLRNRIRRERRVRTQARKEEYRELVSKGHGPTRRSTIVA